MAVSHLSGANRGLARGLSSADETQIKKAIDKQEQAKAAFLRSIDLYDKLERDRPKNDHIVLRGAVLVDLGEYDRAMKDIDRFDELIDRLDAAREKAQAQPGRMPRPPGRKRSESNRFPR